MTDHPTPGSPLSADDVGLLKRGDVLRLTGDCSGFTAGKLFTFSGCDEIMKRCFQLDDGSGQPPKTWAVSRFTFIGRPDADGWIAWSGGENPVGDAFVEVRADDGSTGFGCGDEWDWNSEVAPITAFRLPTDRRAEADTPPSAGPDAGLETVAWVAWDAKTSSRALTFDRPDEMPGRVFSEPLVTRQSAAAALEAAAERERVKDERIALLEDQVRSAVDAAQPLWSGEVSSLQAQVAALREALEAQASEMEELHLFLQGFDADEVGSLAPFDTLVGRIRANAIAARQALSAIPTPGRSE